MGKRTNHHPKYRLHKATGQALVEISGQRFYLGKYGSELSKLEYDRIVAEWLLSGRSPIEDSELVSVADLCERFLVFADGYYRKDGEPTKSIYAYRVAARWLCELYGHRPAAEFGPLGLKTLQQRMIDNGRSRGYINDITQRARSVFKWGAANELVAPAVWHALQAVTGLRKHRSAARETAPVLPVADDVVDATLPHLPKIVADMVRIQRLTGMRPAEVCMMRPCDVDRGEEVWRYIPRTHKTEGHGKTRVIFIGPGAQKILEPYLDRDAESHCFQSRETWVAVRERRSAERVTSLNQGNRPETAKRRGRRGSAPRDRYSSDSYRRAIVRACAKAFPHPTIKPSPFLLDEFAEQLRQWKKQHEWTPNQLRHAAATEIRRAFGLEAAQVILGHSRADVTQIYAERDLQKASDIAARIG
ncbi:MAG: site-specific integrase [Pirellula sp.]|nr:site-specific integrase [Pirellula sp.]